MQQMQVLLTPPRAEAAEQKVADYLKPTLTAASGGYLDAYRIECKHSIHCDETGTVVNQHGVYQAQCSN